MYNVRLRRLLIIIDAVEKQLVLHILSVCLLPLFCSMQSKYPVFSSVAFPLVPYFFALSHKQPYLREKFLIVIFYITFAWNSSHSKKNWARYYRKCTYVFIWSSLYFYQILMKLEFPRQIFEKKSSNIKYHKDPFSRSRDVPCGRTDRQTCEAHVRFSQFCERA
jgi:hypothetical protein